MFHDQGVMRPAHVAVLALALLVAPAVRAAECDAAAGQAAFGKCTACHSLEPGKNVVGPSLHGLDGRKAGVAPGFSYSPALKHSGIAWSTATLDGFITDPQAAVPGNRMPFTGIKEAAERQALICYVLGAK